MKYKDLIASPQEYGYCSVHSFDDAVAVDVAEGDACELLCVFGGNANRAACFAVACTPSARLPQDDRDVYFISTTDAAPE